MSKLSIVGNNTQLTFNHLLNQSSNRDTTQAEGCATCGSSQQKLGAGKTPGQASLLCECGKFIKWLSGSQSAAIASQLKGGQR